MYAINKALEGAFSSKCMRYISHYVAEEMARIISKEKQKLQKQLQAKK